MCANYRFRDVILMAPFEKAFTFIADSRNLPIWTEAFKQVTNKDAVLSTPAGSVRIGLDVEASRKQGTIDWIMTFPDGSIGSAFSRLTRLDHDTCHYGFVLPAPPGPLEKVEGILDEQAATLETELARLAEILKAAEQEAAAG